MTKRQAVDVYHMLDLVNAVGGAAMRNPDMRFAAFSDSVVISADERLVDRFVSVLIFLMRNWTEDQVFVRGGRGPKVRSTGSTTPLTSDFDFFQTFTTPASTVPA